MLVSYLSEQQTNCTFCVLAYASALNELIIVLSNA